MILANEALFESSMRTLLANLRLSYGQKLFLLATSPLILAVAAISVLVANSSRELSEREIQALENQLIEVFSISGKAILRTRNQEIDIAHLEKGIYFVKVEGEQAIRFVKL